MYCKPFLAAVSILLLSCNTKTSASDDTTIAKRTYGSITEYNPPVNINAIPLPAGFKRVAADSASFAAWLRNTSLKKNKTVYLFNGDKKENQSAQFAVLDISVGDKNLQQCADAVMRLRADYLFSIKQFAAIAFTDNANKQYQFLPPYTKEHLHQFMLTVFGMCGSASLSKQLHSVNSDSLQHGDVFIRGGFPGHAEIVMDVAIDQEGKKIFLLAQSYMPAQDIHVLVNPQNEKLSPWYEIADDIITPEYVFDKNELKTW